MLENDQTHLVLASGKLALKKKIKNINTGALSKSLKILNLSIVSVTQVIT